MPLALPALRRETQANMYSLSVWYFSKSVSDLPFDIGTTIVLGTICYWAVGFTTSGLNFLYFMLIMILISILGTGFGLFMGTFAYIMKKPQLAIPFTMVIVFPMFLFAGLLVNFNNCPSYLLWLQYISVFYYGFSLVSINQWKDYGAIECPPSQANPITGQCAYASGQTVLAYFGVDENDQTRNILVVIAMIIFFRVGCYIMLMSLKGGR